MQFMAPASPEEPSSNATPSDPGANGPPKGLDYELVRLIGRGGYGEVWLVRSKSGDYYACKVVYRESFQNDRPYEREYEGICKFEPVSRNSESQIKILHVGRRDALGYFYYIMELADDATTGRAIQPACYVPRTLHSEITSRKRLPTNECIEIGISLSAALENLHRNGLIHRDIKPGNIIFVNGVPKLADIGLVTDLDATISYVGTEGFIPPEGPTSTRADLYSLGKVLYEISTGKDRLQYPELPADFADIPDWESLLELNAVVTKVCESDPSKRYASARELHTDLALLAAGKSIRKRRFARRNWIIAGIVGATIVAILLATSGIVQLVRNPIFRQPNPMIKAPAKIPPPDATAVSQCESKLEGQYRGDLMSGKADSKQRAAAELYDHSLNESDPAMELASLCLAARLVVEAGDFSRAMEICARMTERFDINILPTKADLLSQAAKFAHSPTDQANLAGVAVVAGFQAIAADDYPIANRIAALAHTAAQQSGNTALVWQSGFLADETARCATAWDNVKEAAITLAKDPNDPEANLAMGKFLCFVKNDWAGGLPLLARGSDKTLKPVVTQEIAGTAKDSSQELALGDAWWKLSLATRDDDRESYQERGRYWYLKGIAGARGAEKNSLRQDLSERVNAVPTWPAQIHIFSRVNGTEFIDIYSDQVQWRSSQRGAVANKINQVSIGDFSTGDIQIIKNCGATWLTPEPVDFTTARLDNDRKERHRERARLTIFDDHVRVTLAHQRAGSGAFDVTVIFGVTP
ncbi:MAG TPA: serine/threonine-protein kinase [Verrucomicrobiae bacterium]|jgi:serine/threonine protein kinase|nr:serine/threonine-protein kinase [Verrucomicrobiae bacterium]